MDAGAIYERLMSASAAPRWPGAQTQYAYTAASGPALVKRTLDFIDILERDAPFRPGWRALDYGAGWGRIASLLLEKGGPEQLDLADAWDNSLTLLREGGFQNRIYRVSEVLQRGELPEREYDFVYAFSVFTHLAPHAFWNNLRVLARSVKPGGSLYLTVRHADFVEFKYPERLDEIAHELEASGFWFMPTPRGNLGAHPVFGEAVVLESHLRASCERDLGTLDYLGKPPGQWQHVYALRTRIPRGS